MQRRAPAAAAAKTARTDTPWLPAAAAVLAAVAGLNGCAAHKAVLAAGGVKPDWVDGHSSQYPDSAYLRGVGMGDNRQDAESSARGQIAQYFSSLVTVQTQTFSSEAEKTQGGKTQSSFEDKVSRDIRVASRQTLEGVRIAADWTDPQTHTYYALAVLDRAKASAVMRDKIQTFDRQCSQWQSQFLSASGAFQKAKAAMKLLSLMKARAKLNDQLRLLDGQGLPTPFDAASVKTQAAQALSVLVVSVAVEGPGASRIRSGIVNALSALGLSAAKPGAAADIAINAHVQTQALEVPADTDPGWHWIRSQAVVDFTDERAGRTFLSLKTDDREASVSEQEAKQRSYLGLAAGLTKKVGQALTDYLESQ
jgi:hypothetical protein